MTIDESIVSKVAVPEEFKSTLTDSFGTIEAVRQYLKNVYEENQTPNSQELPNLERRLVLENFNIKKQSDKYYQNLKYYRDKLISSKTAEINKTLYKKETHVKLQKMTQELNSLAQSSMSSIGQIPELKLDYIKDINNYDKLDLESLYSRDHVLEKLSLLDSTIENSDYDESFKKDLKKLQDIIQLEKLQRFKLYILNKSLYTNRYKKLKELDTKWSSRLDEMIKMEETLSKFDDKIRKIGEDEVEKQEDDRILVGLDNGDDEDEEEEEDQGGAEEEEDQGEAEEAEEEEVPREVNETEVRDDNASTTEGEEDEPEVEEEGEENEGDEESNKRPADAEVKLEILEHKKQKTDEMDVDAKEDFVEENNNLSSDNEDIELA